MIAVDTNILVYAHRAESPLHAQAWDVLRQLATGASTWLLPFHCLIEFQQIVTHPKIYRPASSIEIALGFIDRTIASPSVVVGYDSPGTLKQFRAILADTRIVGPQVHDARIAAVCLEHGVSELWSADRGFERISQLNVLNPLIRP